MTTRSTKAAGTTPQPDPSLPAGARPGSADANGGAKPLPTDLELMMCFDGELDDVRSRDILALARTDSGCRTKLQSLRIVSDVLREHTNELRQADDIASLVMERITNEAHPDRSRADSARHHAPAERAAVHDRPANDNARGIFALAAFAVAAAAGLMIWGRMAPDATPPILPPPVAAVTTEAEPAAEPLPPSQADTVEPEAEADHGVEVAAVDFGTRMGTIFYVPTDADSVQHTTTVVWLADDVGGGNE